jgi:hypothetical protein
LTFTGREKDPMAQSGNEADCAFAADATADTTVMTIAPERRDSGFIFSNK